MNSKNLSISLITVIIFIVFTGLSYVFFSKGGRTMKVATTVPTPGSSGQMVFDNTLPKTEACPLNGAMYSKPQKEWWDAHRPLGIMIENSLDARPQSGISSADVVYEAVAEGGITRFLSVFYCQDAGEVGPVRSARTYFLDFISEYGKNPLYTHVGGANTPGPADALSQIDDYGWGGLNDLNQFSIGFPTFWRDYDRLGHTVATEHTMYSTMQKLLQYAKDQRGLTNVDKEGVSWDTTFVPYTFKDDVGAGDRGTVKSIHVEFWKSVSYAGDYFVDWTYDKKTNLLMRVNGGKPHLDKDNGKQLSTKNLVILYMIESHADDGYTDNEHMLYQDKGTGKAVVFMDGKQINGTWKKSSRLSRLQLSDDNGAPIKFDRGTLWFEILPTDGTLKVQ